LCAEHRFTADRIISLSDNRRIRVYISSTFRDMKEGRDELMTHTWPELRRFCRERQIELVAVDLRWGIAEDLRGKSVTELEMYAGQIRLRRP